MSRYYDDELYHHGIKGQKWGVRRFQNTNGTYTSAGKHRRTLADGRAQRAKEEAASAHKLAGKYTNAMDAKAAKRQAQADAKGTRLAKARAIRAKEEAASAHKLANRYTNAMDAKAAKRQAQADRPGLSDRQKTALKVGAAVALTGLAVYGGHKLVFGGQHNANSAIAKAMISNGKTATKQFLSSTGSKVKASSISAAKSAGTEIKKSIKAAPGEIWNAAKEGAKKGTKDAFKVAATGAALHGLQKELERKYGKQDADKIMGYGRKPFPKK